MNNKKINIILLLWIGIHVVVFSAIALYCAHYNFLKTTGFYFSGIDYNEIGNIDATGFNKQHQPVRKIYCLEQHRTTVNYILEDWRWDFKYYDLVDSIQLVIPDTLLPKIEKVWYKYDKTVTCFSNEEFLKTWPHQTINNAVCFSVPEQLKQKNVFYDGVMCMVFMKGNLFRMIRYAMVLCVFVSFLLICIRFYASIKKGIHYFRVKAGKVYMKYRGFLRRLFVFFLGLFFMLVILEVTLRIVGFVHNKKNIEKQFGKTAITKDLVICVGDSFTESFGSTEGNDYPSQLERIINQHHDHPCTVLNFGRSGKNTSQIGIEMPVYIKNYKPHLIILMAGSANYWNYWGYHGSHSLSVFRFVTFFKLLIQNIQHKNQVADFNPEEYMNRRDEYIRSLQKTNIKETPVLKAIRTHNPQIIEKYIDSCRKNNGLSENDYYYLSIYSSLTKNTEDCFHLLDTGNYSSEKIKFYLLLSGKEQKKQTVKITDFSPKYQAVYYYIREMQQSKFDENVLRNCVRINPYFEDACFQLYNQGFHNIPLPKDYHQNCFSIMDTINFYKYLFRLENRSNGFSNVNIEENFDGSMNMKTIDQWVAGDIGSMIELCKSEGIEIIVMNYPLLHHTTLFYPVNAVLKQAAANYDVPFVDNEKIFDQIKTDRDSYFITDGHCSDKGYNLISQNVFQVIAEKKILETTAQKNAK